MIVVIEGISASGKSTWCSLHGQGCAVPELPGGQAPSNPNDHANAAVFWIEQNCSRWHEAVTLEAECRVAVCDTDPLKLHYAWSLLQIGAATEERLQSEIAATRSAVLDEKLGFADAYFVSRLEPDLARKRSAGDTTRQRRNFDLHVRLQPALLAWYRTLGEALGIPVHFELPDHLPATITPKRKNRYDVKLFDKFISSLPDLRP